ncbi:unnamed protein product [Ixodes persulcatus]
MSKAKTKADDKAKDDKPAVVAQKAKEAPEDEKNVVPNKASREVIMVRLGRSSTSRGLNAQSPELGADSPVIQISGGSAANSKTLLIPVGSAIKIIESEQGRSAPCSPILEIAEDSAYSPEGPIPCQDCLKEMPTGRTRRSRETISVTLVSKPPGDNYYRDGSPPGGPVSYMREVSGYINNRGGVGYDRWDSAIGNRPQPFSSPPPSPQSPMSPSFVAIDDQFEIRQRALEVLDDVLRRSSSVGQTDAEYDFDYVPRSYDSRPASAEFVARETWEQYRQEFQRYKADMAKWEQLHGVMRGATPPPTKPTRPVQQQLSQNRSINLSWEEPVNIRIGVRRRRSGVSDTPSLAGGVEKT